MEIQCCKCAKSRHKDGWRWTDGFTDGPKSYSYCPECLDEFRSEVGLVRHEVMENPPRLFAAAYA
jgi:hypothetical protein